MLTTEKTEYQLAMEEELEVLVGKLPREQKGRATGPGGKLSLVAAAASFISPAGLPATKR